MSKIHVDHYFSEPACHMLLKNHISAFGLILSMDILCITQ